jgi:AcrR family transcriptional regulator
MPRIDVRPRKAPRQARAAKTVEVLLAAAARVLRRESLAGFNTNRVAEVAGVSVGSLYQYFPNKAALVAALIDREQTALALALETLIAEHAGRSLDDTLRAVAQLAIEQQYSDPVYAAALDHEEQRLPLGARLSQAEKRFAAAAQTLIERHGHQLSPSLPPGAARDLLLITKALVEADAQSSRSPPPGLQDRIIRALRGYLLTP